MISSFLVKLIQTLLYYNYCTRNLHSIVDIVNRCLASIHYQQILRLGKYSVIRH